MHIDIDPARGRTDLLQISGRAALDGAIVVNPISVHKGTSGPVITAAGGLTVTPLLQGTTGLVFTHTPLVLGNSLSIATDADFKSNDLSKSANQRSVAGHLQRIWDSGAPGFDQGFLSLSRLSSVRAYTQALDSLSGEVHASTAGVLVDESRYMRGAVLGRLRQAPFDSGAGPLAALGIGGPELSQVEAAYAADFPVKALPIAPSPASPTRSGRRVSAPGASSRATAMRRTSTATSAAPLSVSIVGSARTGAWASRPATRSRTFVDARQSSATVDSAHAAIYGGKSFGAWNLRGGAAYALHQIDTGRTIPGFGRTTTDHDGGTGQIFGELGYGFALGKVAIEPFAGLAWVQTTPTASRRRRAPRRWWAGALPRMLVTRHWARGLRPPSRSPTEWR